MLLVEKFSNVLDDRKEAVVTTQFLEKKSLIKDVDKGNGELEYMKEAVVTICRKDLDNFEGRSKGSTGWFKLDSEFFFNLQFIHNSIKNFLKSILRVKTRNCIKRLLYRLIKNRPRKICKNGPNLITQSEAPAP